MRRRLYYLLVIPLFVLSGCIKKPDYPDAPSIEFFSLNRYIITNSNFSGETDSIVFTVLFKDGTGDMGLAPTEPPYSEYDIQFNSSGDTIKYNGTPPYSCENYTILNGKDTVLITRNIHFNNYFIELLVKQPNGTYLPFEFPDCGSLMGRYPPLAPQGYKGPLEGSLSFTLINKLKTPLENKTIKFRLSIEDRSFNKSNTVESNDILLTY
jgi:hypothetical protein